MNDDFEPRWIRPLSPDHHPIRTRRRKVEVTQVTSTPEPRRPFRAAVVRCLRRLAALIEGRS